MLSIKYHLWASIAFVFVLIFPNLLSAQKTTSQEVFTTNGQTFIHNQRKSIKKSLTCLPSEFRTIDGTCNNTSASERMEWGASDVILMREMSSNYGAADPFNAMSGEERVSPRAISNALNAQEESIPSERELSSLVFTWGQFLDHDISLTPEAHTEPAPISLPDNEPLFTADIGFFRSEIAEGTGESNERQHRNLITSWIDGSNVYGSDQERADWLRTFSNGKLKTSDGDLLPFNTIDGEYGSEIDPSAPSMAGDTDRAGNKSKIYVAGDVRAAEQPGLTSLHTLFVREHNRICDLLDEQGFTDDEEMYQIARKWVGAIIQSITFNEFLPALGVELGSYKGYDDNVQPDIFNLFATAAYRLGHTMVTEEILLVDAECREDGTVTLLESFFNPEMLREHGIVRVLNGLHKQTQEKVDLQVIDNLRNFLFGDPSSGAAFGLDLASLNIQRGRDHGIPDYNTIRAYFLGNAAAKYGDITKNPDRQNGLRNMYGSLNDIDPWVGLLSEDHVPGTSLGPTLQAIMQIQFSRLRDCDFFYFEKDDYLSEEIKSMISSVGLSDVILVNTSLKKLSQNAFFSSTCSSSNYRGDDLEPDFANDNDDDQNNNGNGGNGNNGNGGNGNNGNGGNGNNGNGGNGNNGNGNGGGRGNGQGGNNGQGNLQGDNGDNNVGASVLFSNDEDQDLITSINIGPNPTSDILTIGLVGFQNSSDLTVTLIDFLGRQVMQANIESTQISSRSELDISGLGSGAYVVQLKKGQQIIHTENLIIGN